MDEGAENTPSLEGQQKRGFWGRWGETPFVALTACLAAGIAISALRFPVQFCGAGGCISGAHLGSMSGSHPEPSEALPVSRAVRDTPGWHPAGIGRTECVFPR